MKNTEFQNSCLRFFLDIQINKRKSGVMKKEKEESGDYSFNWMMLEIAAWKILRAAQKEQRRRGQIKAWAKMKSVTAEAQYKTGDRL